MPSIPVGSASSRFEVHGDYSIAVEGQILISHLRGPFNLELARAYFDALTPFVRPLAARGSWASVAVFTQSALFPLDAVTVMRERAEAASQIGVIANCWFVPPAVEGYGFVDIVGQKVYGGLCDFEVFERYEDAHAWMVQRLRDRQ